MNKINKFCIITPCLNCEKLIEETIKSVLTQNAVIKNRVKLEYIICDGGSTDNTLNIIKSHNTNNEITIISEKDLGMYDALAKGIKLCTGDVCSYINAGDLYYKMAFDVVLDIMENYESKWLTGMNAFYNEQSQIISFMLPFKYRRKFITAGIYGTILPFIQQESTFWNAELNKLLDYEKLRSFKMAGDFYLWYTFSKTSQLHIVQSHLGGFKIHNEQLSKNLKLYFLEMRSLYKKNYLINILAYLEYIVWKFPGRIKKLLNMKGYFQYDFKSNSWK